MGVVRWCKNCHLSHEGLTGSKCQRFEAPLQLDSSQEESGEQASNVNLRDTSVTEEQARLAAQQVEEKEIKDREDNQGTGGKCESRFNIATTEKHI